MKRLRAPNFTQSDNLLLCEIVEKHRQVIENKKTDGANLLQKQKAWMEVAKQYNATTTGCARTVESLQQTYKNLKKKVKKQSSDSKMVIPVDKATLVASIEEERGTQREGLDTNWSRVALNTGASESRCKTMFASLTKEANKQERILKKNIMATGGGPSQKPDTDPVLEKVKALAGPAMEGLYTIYDGDRSLMEIQNVPPIEYGTIPETAETPDVDSDVDGTYLLTCTTPDMPSTQENDETYFTNDRANLKKKQHRLLTCKQKAETKKETVADKFKLLACEKMDLLEIQKDLAIAQLKETREQSEHNSILRAMEIDDAKKKFKHNQEIREIEKEELKKRTEFNEKMRQY